MQTFLDEAGIEVIAGNGGRGSVSFRREMHVPLGGPDGGDGGRGGSIVIVADRNMTTLLDFHYNIRYRADNGVDGEGGLKSGKNAQNLILRVPLGTVVQDAETGGKIVDLTLPGQEFVIAKGGVGGFGNVRYKSPSRQAPRIAQKGEPGETRKLKLLLKLIADVGIIGYPNAGKSTLISRASAAKPKIADYPFTTLVPNLGLVRVGDNSFVMADMPGLIEGAHQGVGLGDRFLRHIERTRILLHMIDMSPMQLLDPVQAFDNINRELELYSDALGQKPMVVALNKIDTLHDKSTLFETQEILESRGLKVFAVSAASGHGIEPLLFYLDEMLKTLPLVVDTEEAIEVITAKRTVASQWSVKEVEPHVFLVEGKGIERMVAMTDMSNEEAVLYLHKRLDKLGVIEALSNAGIGEGDTVRIGGTEFNFVEGL
jgi:GTP-binding protein